MRLLHCTAGTLPSPISDFGKSPGRCGRLGYCQGRLSLAQRKQEGKGRHEEWPLTFVTPLRLRATVWDFSVVCSTRLRRVSNSFWGSRMRRHGYSVALWKKDMSGHNLLSRGNRRQPVTQDGGFRHSISINASAPAAQRCFRKINNVLFKK